MANDGRNRNLKQSQHTTAQYFSCTIKSAQPPSVASSLKPLAKTLTTPPREDVLRLFPIGTTVVTESSITYGHHIYQSMDQPGKVANPARGLLNRENNIPLSPCVPENLVSRDGFSHPVPRQPAHLHTQAESGAYLRDSSRVPRRRPFMKPPYVIGSVPSLSGHAIAYGWRLLPGVRRYRASKPQGSSERVLPWQITMDQLITSLFPIPTIGMKWAC